MTPGTSSSLSSRRRTLYCCTRSLEKDSQGSGGVDTLIGMNLDGVWFPIQVRIRIPDFTTPTPTWWSDSPDPPVRRVGPGPEWCTSEGHLGHSRVGNVGAVRVSRLDSRPSVAFRPDPLCLDVSTGARGGSTPEDLDTPSPSVEGGTSREATADRPGR